MDDKFDTAIETLDYNLLDSSTSDDGKVVFSDGSFDTAPSYITHYIDVTEYRNAYVYTYNSAANNRYARSWAFFSSTTLTSANFISGNNGINSSYPVRIPADAVVMAVAFAKKSLGGGGYTLPDAYYVALTNFANADNLSRDSVVIHKPYTPKMQDELRINKEVNYSSSYVRARKPIICITLDAETISNADIVRIAETKGFRIGIALDYYEATNQTNLKRATYLEYQKKGHEILQHSGFNIGPDSTYTEEQIASMMKDMYDAMIGYGFNIRGYVAYQGKSSEFSRNEAHKYYDYGFMRPNQSGSFADPCLSPSIDTYNLYRYSMQGSTLAQQKAAVDKCIADGSLLCLYGHIAPGQTDYFTLENFDALCTYIVNKGTAVEVDTPYNAMKKFFAPRIQDFVKWDSIDATAGTGVEIISDGSRKNDLTKMCVINYRLRTTSAVSGSNYTLLSGLPKELDGQVTITTSSGLNLYISGGNLKASSMDVPSMTNIYLTTAYLYKI